MSNGVHKMSGAGAVRTWPQALQFCRKKEQLTIPQLAEGVRCDFHTIELWETGAAAPSQRMLSRLHARLAGLHRFAFLLDKAAVRAATEVENARRKGRPVEPPRPPPKMPTLAEIRAAAEPPPPPKVLDPSPVPPTASPSVSPPAAVPPSPPPPPAAASLPAWIAGNLMERLKRATTFGEALRICRETRGWGQLEVAKRVGWEGQSSVSSLEVNKNDGRMIQRSYHRVVSLFPELAAPGVPRPRSKAGVPLEPPPEVLARIRAPVPPPVAPPPPPAPEPEPEPERPAIEAKVVSVETVPPPAPPAPLALPALTSDEDLAVEMARAMVAAKKAIAECAEALKVAQEAEARKNAAVQRANDLRRQLEERTNWMEAIK